MPALSESARTADVFRPSLPLICECGCRVCVSAIARLDTHGGVEVHEASSARPRDRVEQDERARRPVARRTALPPGGGASIRIGTDRQERRSEDAGALEPGRRLQTDLLIDRHETGVSEHRVSRESRRVPRDGYTGRSLRDARRAGSIEEQASPANADDAPDHHDAPPARKRGKTVHGEAANAGHRVLASDDAEVEAYLETALNAPDPTARRADRPGGAIPGASPPVRAGHRRRHRLREPVRPADRAARPRAQRLLRAHPVRHAVGGHRPPQAQGA